MKLQIFRRALLVSALFLSACHSNRNAVRDEETIKVQTEQISQLIELSKKQSEQISQLAGALEAEKRAASERKNSADAQTQPSPAMSRFSITGSAYITRGGGSAMLRDLRVLLLANAQVRWSAYVKDGASYSLDMNEDRLRHDLDQFSVNVNDLIAAYTTTDVDGKYKFANVAPGDYYLFAEYIGGETAFGWFIPVSVQKDGTPLEVNLANSTAYAIAWRKMK